jgi:hypothetical protein
MKAERLGIQAGQTFAEQKITPMVTVTGGNQNKIGE